MPKRRQISGNSHLSRCGGLFGKFEIHGSGEAGGRPRSGALTLGRRASGTLAKSGALGCRAPASGGRGGCCACAPVGKKMGG